MNRAKHVAGFLFLSIGSFVGCLADDDPTTSESTEEQAEEYYTVTVVDLDRGGIVVSERLVSASERIESRRQAELAREGLGSTSDAITHDTDCLPLIPSLSLLKIYDAQNLGGNVICFSGTGLADLHNYCRTVLPSGGCDTWAGNVASYVTGVASVAFSPDGACCHVCGSTAANTTVNDSACDGAEWFWRNDTGCAPC